MKFISCTQLNTYKTGLYHQSKLIEHVMFVGAIKILMVILTILIEDIHLCVL